MQTTYQAQSNMPVLLIQPKHRQSAYLSRLPNLTPQSLKDHTTRKCPSSKLPPISPTTMLQIPDRV